MRRAVTLRLAALACAAWCIGASAHEGRHADARPGYLRSVASYALPDEMLVDMDGKPFALRADLDRGGPVMVNFVFTSCAATCPVMSATFAEVQRRLAAEERGLRLVSISIDPEHDTPARLRDYAAKYGASPGWRFVTGSAEASLAAQRAFDVYRGGVMNHEPITLLRAAPGEPWVRLDGFASARELIGEYRKLVQR